MTTVSREEMQLAAVPWLLIEHVHGIDITNDRGETVHTVEWLNIPDERGPAFRERMIQLERAFAKIIVAGANSLADKPADDGVRPSLQPANIRAWMMATPFTQCTEWSKYVDHMLRALSTKAKPDA